MDKIRLDKFVSLNFPNFSRERAKECIKNNLISLNGKVINSPNFLVNPHSIKIENLESTHLRSNLDSKKFILRIDKRGFSQDLPIVGRGFIKMDGFLEENPFLKDLIKDALVLDIGASSGGFTQCLLKYSPYLIIAQDVGTNQFNKNLLQENTLSIEGVDIRDFAAILHKNKTITKDNIKSTLTKIFLDSKNLLSTKMEDLLCDIAPTNSTAQHIHIFDLIVCDISFISIRNIFNSIKDLATYFILLYKPQFEVGKDFKRNKKGVLSTKEEKRIYQNLNNFIDFLSQNNAKDILKKKSSLKGKEGNVEFFIFFRM